MFTVNKLKIIGFKSFVYPTELLIEEGVSGIIGPNGCGKSNIFEAIRWVMGESSSKSLRSGSMDDVIFNGTENLPAKNFAEVSIELNNFEDEISNIDIKDKKLIISRTIERGVGSFYKINNKDVRAKDINILFSDSGSGPRSSSIIGQGNIDQIINFKPIDRKIILEDAAGISGLQARRHESELKLHATEINLEKIDINLNGLIEQKKNLSRQARQAHRYEQISESIKYFQSLLIFQEWKSVVNEIEGFKNKINNSAGLLKKIIEESKNQKNLMENKNREIQEIQKSKESFSNNLYKVEGEIKNLENNLESVETKKNEIRAFITTIGNDLSLEKKRFSEIQNYINDLNKRINDSDHLKKSKNRLVELDLEESKLKSEIKKLETIFVNEIQLTLGEEFKSDNLKETKENLVNNRLKIEKEIKNNNKIISDCESLLKKNENNHQERLNKNKSLEKNIAELKNNINSLTKQKISSKNTINELILKSEEITKKLTQFQTEIKTLDRLKGNMNLSKESIVNLLKIKKGYDNSVYAALMHELDATLKKSPKRWEYKRNEQHIEPIENPLSNFVTAPKELLPVLSQIGLVSKKEEGLKKQKELKTGQMLVDLHGNIWRWDGFISEDNLQKKKFIDYQLKIDHLISEEKKMAEKLNQINNKKINEINLEKKIYENDNILKKKIEHSQKTLDETLLKLSSLKDKISISKNNMDKFKEKNTFLNREKERLNKEIKIIEDKEFDFSKNGEEKSKPQKDNLQKNIQSLDQKLEEKRREISYLKEEIMKKEINRTFNLNDIEKNKTRILDCNKQIKILYERKGLYLKEEKKLENLPNELNKKIIDLQGHQNEIKKKLNEIENSLLEVVESYKKAESKFYQLEKSRENQRNEMVRIESSLENYSIKEKELRKLIFDRSSSQPEELEKELQENKKNNLELENEQSIKEKLEKLNFQREQMGPVNLRAKLEEEEISKSINELELEKNDLFQAIEKLRVAINKINHEGKNRLVVAFEKVNKNFSDLFTKLFEGGEAKLELIRSDDPLQTGLEIFARPPGKKLSTISLLSGGEKTLTAIALIFSIFLTNPSPICILDEVDAALDDLNVEKFCKILAELKNATKTKFLIITHHKFTMASIDRVYGVTMAQKGISDIVSIDFANDESIKSSAP